MAGEEEEADMFAAELLEEVAERGGALRLADLSRFLRRVVPFFRFRVARLASADFSDLV